MDMSSLLLECGALYFILRIQTGMRHSLHAWEVYNGPEQWDLCIENYFSIVQCSRICMEESGWCSNSDSSIHWLLTKPLSHSEVQIHQAMQQVKGTAFIGDVKTYTSYRTVPIPENLRECALLLRKFGGKDLRFSMKMMFAPDSETPMPPFELLRKVHLISEASR